MDIYFVIFFSYICGSIPFGLLLTRIFSKIDIRKVGSGNIGATNVLRTGNKTLAVLTLLFDVLKGYFPVIISIKYFPEFILLSSLLTFLGHVFPIWIKFKGGKGVATYLGVLLALSIQLGLLFIFTWVTVSLIFKYSSLSSMFSSLTVFVVTLFRETVITIFSLVPAEQSKNINISIEMSFLLFVFFILIIFTHRQNISNLKNKTEQKIKI
tara:strand:- start:545 stop:1177 length:633 start_codon:yes stop_codon:yes gene_type:complete